MAELAGILCFFGSRVLILRRAVEGTWDLPKGRVRCDETLRQGAMRETFEETGLRPRLTGAVVSTNHQGDSYWIFIGAVQQVDVSLSKEHDKARWVTRAEATSLLYPPLARIVRDDDK